MGLTFHPGSATDPTSFPTAIVYWFLRTFLRIYVVDAYGATGDGSTDDTDAFTDALTAIGSAFGILFLLNKTYVVKTGTTYTGAISISNSRTLVLGVPGAKLKADAATSVGIRMISIAADFVWVIGLRFDPNDITDATCTYWDSARWGAALFCQSDAPKSGLVHIKNAVFDFLMLGCTTNGKGYGALVEDPTSGGRYVFVLNVLHGAADGGDGIGVNCPTTGVAGVIAALNIVQGYTATSGDAGFGIAFSGVSYGIAALNVTRDCSRNGIHFEDATNFAVMLGNIAEGCGHAGLEYQAVNFGGGVVNCFAVVIALNISYNNCLAPQADSLGNAGFDLGSGADGTYLGTLTLFVCVGNIAYENAAGGFFGYEVRRSIWALNIAANNTGPGFDVTTIVEGLFVANLATDTRSGVAELQTHGLKTFGSGENALFALNMLVGNATAAVDNGFSTAPKWRHNLGLVTETSGTATVASGATTVVVNHGLSLTPALKDISLTPTNNLGNAAKFWIATPTATQFTVTVNADPGATTATFVWKAEIL